MNSGGDGGEVVGDWEWNENHVDSKKLKLKLK